MIDLLIKSIVVKNETNCKQYHRSTVSLDLPLVIQ